MACPYFFPITRHDAELWPHRRRLPLGDGFSGRCTSPGHEFTPSDAELGECCNLGYASQCRHLPVERQADAVHFCIGRDQDGIVQVCWVMVKDHASAGHGTLEFERTSRTWRARHDSETVQQMAECYLNAYFAKRPPEAS
jgi:hypothetical protein